MGKSLSDIYFDKYKDMNLKEIFVEMDNDTINQILLEIFKERSKSITPNKVLERYIKNSEYFAPSSVPLDKTLKYNLIFLNLLPKHYNSLDLSLINPFGTNSSVTELSQNLMLTTIKNSEVCGDPTTALTLEACKRRKDIINSSKDIYEEVNLATVNQVLRMQRFDVSKGYMQHFNLFGMVSSTRKQSNVRFDILKIKEHLAVWLNLCESLKEKKFSLGQIEVGITDISFVEHLVKNGFVDRKIVNENSFNDYDLFENQKILIPKKIKKYSDLDDNTIENYKLYLLKNKIEEIINKIIEPLESEFPNVNFHIEMDRKGGLGYYNGLCFHIYSNDEGNIVPLCDGGTTDWNAKLLSDKKEVSVASGFGSELIIKLFGNDADL